MLTVVETSEYKVRPTFVVGTSGDSLRSAWKALFEECVVGYQERAGRLTNVSVPEIVDDHVQPTVCQSWQ